MGCLSRIRSHIEEIEKLIQFSNDVKDLHKTYKGHIHWEILNEQEKDDVKKRLRINPPRTEVSDCALLVFAWGAFEQFLRGLMSEYITNINQSDGTKPIDRKLKNQHTIYTCKAIIDSFEEEPKFEKTGSRERLSLNLHKTITGEAANSLNDHVLSIIDFRINPETILEMFNRRISTEIKWHDVGDSEDLKTYFKTTSKHESGKLTEELVGWIYNKRNKIAHTGNTDLSLSPYSIGELTQFIKLTSESLFSLVCGST